MTERPLPRGTPEALAAGASRPLLSPRFVALHKRRRLIQGLAELCAEQGYATITIKDLCRRTRLARGTFYEHFSNLQEVFLATVEAGLGEAAQLVEDACDASSGDFEERLGAGLAVLLDFVASRPEMAWVCLIEAPAVMPSGFERYDAAMAHWAQSIRAIAPAPRPTEAAVDFVLGGIASVVRTRLRHGEAEGVGALAPQLSGFVTASLRDSSRPGRPG